MVRPGFEVIREISDTIFERLEGLLRDKVTITTIIILKYTLTKYSLANCELFLIIGSIFRRYDLEIYNTSEVDITPARDYMIGYPMKESRGFHVLARNRAH